MLSNNERMVLGLTSLWLSIMTLPLSSVGLHGSSLGSPPMQCSWLALLGEIYVPSTLIKLSSSFVEQGSKYYSKCMTLIGEVASKQSTRLGILTSHKLVLNAAIGAGGSVAMLSTTSQILCFKAQ